MSFQHLSITEIPATVTAVTAQRLIDDDPATFTKVKKVLVLGMPRTSSNSMFVALAQLGFNPYYMKAAVANHERDIPLWNEAYEAKFLGVGKPYSREEFDKLLGPYEEVTDAPCAYLAEDFINAYPDAKVILTNQDPGKWIESMNSTVFKVHDSTKYKLLSKVDSLFFGPFLNGSAIVEKNIWGDHYNRIRELVPSNRLLEFDAGDGWKPLCDFLGVPVPENEYPRVNEPKAFIQAFEAIKAEAIKSIIRRIIPAILAWILFWIPLLLFFGLEAFLALYLSAFLIFGVDESKGEIDITSILVVNQPPPSPPAPKQYSPRSIPPHLRPRKTPPPSRQITPSPPRDRVSPSKSSSPEPRSRSSSEKSSSTDDRRKWGKYARQMAELRSNKSSPSPPPKSAPKPKPAVVPAGPLKRPQQPYNTAKWVGSASWIQQDDARRVAKAKEREKEFLGGWRPQMSESFTPTREGKKVGKKETFLHEEINGDAK